MSKVKAPKLPEDTKTHYFVAEPIFDHYREVTVIDRCECCDHKTGSHKEKRGVKITGYKVKKYKKDALYYMRKMMEERFLASANFFLGMDYGKDEGSVLKIKRVSEL